MGSDLLQEEKRLRDATEMRSKMDFISSELISLSVQEKNILCTMANNLC